jgi:hypothetical protein
MWANPSTIMLAVFIVFVVLPICFCAIGWLAVRISELLQKRLTRVNAGHLRR